MSKIFEALQRSVSETTGHPLVQASSVATELLNETEKSQSFESYSAMSPRPSPESRAIAITDPASIAAEKFRMLAVRLRSLRQKRELKRILITSALPDEGKSVVALNLACTLARYKQMRVLLVEGDMHRPKIRTNLDLPTVKGLSEWLRSDIPLSESIYRVTPSGFGFWFLPAGEPVTNAVELMQSGRLAALLDDLTESFDWIIIDSTPILPVADTSVWARLSQGILMVVREGKTEKRQLEKALELIDKSALIGVVLNDSTNTEHKSYYTYYSRGNPINRRSTDSPKIDRPASAARALPWWRS
jgi:capsular exopolysaccharide synthesis family protein